jgi:hypothetical protein
MRLPFKLRRRQSYPWWFAAVAAFLGGLFLLLPTNLQTAELLLAVIGAAAAFFHFLYGQHNFNTERFVELFAQFNARFDDLNDDLNRIRDEHADTPLAPKDMQVLYDYFNLCGEEYLYFKAGFIDGSVWRSWLNGMSHFAAGERIQRVWASELKQDSYYGFSLDLLDLPPNNHMQRAGSP